MGYYINFIKGKHIGSSFPEKCKAIEDAGGQPITTPSEFESNLVCVVDNGMFAAAAYVYNEREMEDFKHPDGRPKQWYTLEDVEKYVD